MSFLRVTLRHKIAAIGLVGVLGIVLIGAIYWLGALSQARFSGQRRAGPPLPPRPTTSCMLHCSRQDAPKRTFSCATMSGMPRNRLASPRRLPQSSLRSSSNSPAASSRGLLPRVEATQSGFDVYVKTFTTLADAKRKLGLDQDSGLEGQLRKSVHEIESGIKTLADARLDAAMLTMRRHENRISCCAMNAKYG